MWFLAVLPILQIVSSCGVSVHLELVDRLVPLLPPRIAEHYDYLRSGAFFPDAFYNCQGQYDVAEDAHWPPFLVHGITLVHRQRSLGRDTSQLEAFLVGVLSHQVSDVSWHSLGLFEGLLRAMADSEFGGDYDRAHTVLDVGGDMIFLSRRATKSATSTDWAYNADDILSLVTAAGYPAIPLSSIHYCMARGSAAYSAETRVASVAFKRFARRSPLLFNTLESYPVGGLTDMAEQIAECLPAVLSWIQQPEKVKEPGFSPWEVCQVFEGKTPSELRKRSSGHVHRLKHYMADVIEIVKDIEPEVVRKVAPRSKSQQLEAKVVAGPQPALPQRTQPDLAQGQPDLALLAQPGQSGSAQSHSPLFGFSVKFWGHNIAVGAPGSGQVFILNEHGDLTNSINATTSHLKLPGEWPARFGAALEVWKSYLVVASPGLSQLDVYNSQLEWIGGIQWADASYAYGRLGLKLVGERLVADKSDHTLYVGAPSADVYDGTDESRVDQAGVVFALPESLLQHIVDHPGYVTLSRTEHVLHEGSQAYDRVGSAISVAPRFVLVGVPGRSQVLGFDFARKTPILELTEPSGTNLTGFGAFSLAGNRNYLVVGAPSYGENQEGAIITYKNNHHQIISNANEFDWFGHHGLVVGDRFIGASAHANGGYGMLWEVDLKTGTTKMLGTEKLAFAAGFGEAMDTNGTLLVVGMPFMASSGNTLQKSGGVALVKI